MDQHLKHKEVRKLIKRNELQEVLGQGGQYFSKHMENIIIVGIVAAIVLVAIPVYINHMNTMEQKAEQIMAYADMYMNAPILDNAKANMYGMFKTKQEKYEKITDTYMEVIKTYRNTKAAPYANMGLGNAYFDRGMFKEAIDYYTTVVEKYPRSILVGEALQGRGFAYYELGNYKEAIADLEAFISKYKNDYNYYDVEIKLADSYLKANDSAKAKKIYEDIAAGQKDSLWASMAKERMSSLK
jgi:tetratricopeptide (TPR) repeat protein